MSTRSAEFDFVLVGGGLQSGLIALALRYHRPDVSIAMVEQASSLAGNHTWSFHETDVPDDAVGWLAPLNEYKWSGYEIAVGGLSKSVEIGYRSVSSVHFAKVVERSLMGSHQVDAETESATCKILLDARVVHCTPKTVLMADGRSLKAKCVVDCRGPRRDEGFDEKRFPGGFQKFWGFELQLPSDWLSTRPIIMDDRVEQEDGFRFFYTLPFGPRRILVEDTRFSNNPLIHRADCFLQVDRYLRSMSHGRLSIERCEIVREESGVLPMPYRGSMPDANGTIMAGGYRGGWCHAATGYSFPMAVQFAQCLAMNSINELPIAVTHLVQRNRWQARFSRLLNRLLFRLVSPRTRYQIFRRFYRVLSDDQIARFYSHRFSLGDAVRIIVGIPPTGLRPLDFMKSFFDRESYPKTLDPGDAGVVESTGSIQSTKESARGKEVIS
ncbi:MAG: lycopene beta-cyclase CrtY [Planctomycetota bacterium]